MTTTGEALVPATTIAGIAMASALVPLNSTMLAVALPHIARDFDISKGDTSVLITVYLVAMLIGQPLAGRLGDLVGARRLALVAVAGFGVCSTGAMLAPSFPMLVMFRALQAAFAAALAPSVQTMLREIVSPQQRGRAFGVQGSVQGVGAGLGPIIGGLATAAFGWRAIFGVNLPLVVVVLIVLQRRLPHTTGHLAHHRSAAEHGSERMFNGAFTVAFSIQVLCSFANFALLLVAPIVLDSRGWSAAEVGVGLSFLTLGMVVMSPYGGRAGDSQGRRRPVVLGLAVTVLALAASAAFGDDVPSWLLLTTLLLFGLGLGLASPSVLTAGIEAAPDGRVGAAAGLLSASRYLGTIAATILMATVVDDDGRGLATFLTACAVALALSLASARRLPGPRPLAASA